MNADREAAIRARLAAGLPNLKCSDVHPTMDVYHPDGHGPDPILADLEHLLALVGRQRAGLDAVRAEIDSWQHLTVEDCWYSCGLTHGQEVDDACCDDGKAGRCTCGLTYRRERLDVALAAADEWKNP